MKGELLIFISGVSEPFKELYEDNSIAKIDKHFEDRMSDFLVDGVLHVHDGADGGPQRWIYPPHRIDHVTWVITD